MAQAHLVNISQIQNLSSILDSKFNTLDFSTLFINNDNISYYYDTNTGKITTTINTLSLTNISVDDTSTDFNDFLANFYQNGDEYSEGDTIIFTAFSDMMTHTYIHNGGTNGDATDFTEISNNVDPAFIRSQLSGVSPIIYNSSSGSISIQNGYYLENQFLTNQTADFKISGKGYIGDYLQIGSANVTAKLNISTNGDYIYFGDNTKNLMINSNLDFIMTFSNAPLTLLSASPTVVTLKSNSILELKANKLHLMNGTAISKFSNETVYTTTSVGSQEAKTVQYIETTDTTSHIAISYPLDNITTSAFNISITCKNTNNVSFLTNFEGVIYYDSVSSTFKFVPSYTRTTYWTDYVSINPTITINGSVLEVSVRSLTTITYRWVISMTCLEVKL